MGRLVFISIPNGHYSCFFSYLYALFIVMTVAIVNKK